MCDNIEACLDAWTHGFGDDYTFRNSSSEENIQSRGRMLLKILNELKSRPTSIAEIGAGEGANLRALGRILGPAPVLYAIEPNGLARDKMVMEHTGEIDNIRDGSASQIPLDDASVDMAFTSGVLIHIPPDELGKALDEIHRVARRWIVAIEYFSPSLVSVPYRGRDDLMWKADYGSLYLDRFPSLQCVAYGFEWRRMTGLDNVTWWVLEKTA
jgi:pseudaminic acid biosynthesis-associated methylase